MIDVIGNAVRTEILRRLARGPMTSAQLSQDLAINQGSIHRHLLALEDLSLVEGDRARGHRRGRIPSQWTAIPETIDALSKAWAGYARGD